MSNLPPGLLLLLAPLLGLVRQPLVRRVGFVLLPVLSLVHLACFVPEGTIVNATWMGIDLVPVRADRIPYQHVHQSSGKPHTNQP